MDNKVNQNIKGMNLDSLSHQLGQGEISWSLNSNIQSLDGSRFTYSNELGNQLCTRFKPGFQVVGQPYYVVEKNLIIFALYNPTTNESEIGQVTAFNNDCLHLVSHEEDCGCEKGSILEDEVVEVLHEETIPCEPSGTCDCYTLELVDPNASDNFFEVYYTDCFGVSHESGDPLSTITLGIPFCVKNDDIKYVDPRVRLVHLSSTQITDCEPTTITTCCSYQTVLNTPCLNFNPDYPVTFRHKQTACDTFLYFISRNNPPRRISLSIPKGVDACGKPQVMPNCDEMDIFPKSCHPDIFPYLQESGGSLKAGSYRFTLAYSDRLGNEYTDYFDLTSEVPVFERKVTYDTDYITSKAISLRITHSTDIFDYFNLAVEETVNGVSAYYLIGTFKVNQVENFTYTGNFKEEYSSIRVLNRTPRYETAGIIEDSDDILFLADLEADIEYNLQPLCNEIKLNWETVNMPANKPNYNYSNGIIVSHFRGYMRDEVYPFGIKFKLKSGKYTRIFHIPGRFAEGKDLGMVAADNPDVFNTDRNCLDPVIQKEWEVYNTGSKNPLPKRCRIRDEKAEQFDCEIFQDEQGEFSYWESSLTYPCNPEIWGTLADQPIRFHKFPDCAVKHIHSDGDSYTNNRQEIYPIGVRPDMDILNDLLNNFLIYNPKTKRKDIRLRDLICGFELVRGSRVGNKSVLAKGLIFDVGKAKDEENNRSYYFPNYPYNDTRDLNDPFLSGSSKVYNEADQGTEFANVKQYGGVDFTRFTFHSPDTHFQFPQIGTEVKLESCEWGEWRGHFVPVAEHPRYRFLTKYDMLLSAAIGSALSLKYSSDTKGILNPPISVGTEDGETTGFDIASVLTNTEVMRDLIEKSLPHINYAWNYHSQAEYSRYVIPAKRNIRRRLDLGQYLSPNNQVVGDDLPVWNYQRESSVYLKVNTRFHDANPAITDNSRNSISSHNSNWCEDPYIERHGQVKANYVSIKRTNKDQYGPINNITYVSTGDFYHTEKIANGESIFHCKFYPTFGGDIFINKFSLKRKMPFFTQNMVGRPDGVNFDYWLTPNVLYPTYYIGTSSDSVTLKELFANGAGIEILAGTALLIGAAAAPLGPPPASTLIKAAKVLGTMSLSAGMGTLIVNLLSSFVAKNNLDCDNTMFAGGFNLKEFADIFLDTGKPGNPFQQEGKFYLAAYGIPTFFVESEVNVDMRHGRNPDEENFYPNAGSGIPDDWLQEKRVPIKFDNYYSYNGTYSKQNFENYNEPYSNFSPDEICQSYFPNRIIYSDESNREEKRDSWLIYRTNNYFDFPKTNGRLIGINSIENSKVLARFENTTQAYNSRIVLDSSYPTQIELGTGGMFAQKPVDYVKADIGYVGSQHKAYISCKYGSFWTDAKRGFVYQLSGSSGFDEISKNNFNWFKRNLPFAILEDFPTYNIDNSFKDIGIALGWDERFERLFITKKDYRLLPEFKGKVTYDGNFKLEDTIIFVEDSQYFENKSFTIAYSPITKSWISFYSFLPDYYVGLTTHFQTGNKQGLWNHLLSPLRYQYFYDKLESYILEYTVDTLPQVSTVNSVTVIQDIQKFYNNTDFYSLGSANTSNKINFNKAFLYNKEQCSGMLHLVPEDPKNLSQRLKYPRINKDHIEVLYSHRENKFTFNGFWNANYAQNNQPIFSTDWKLLKNSYFTDKVINPKAISYTMRQGFQVPLKSTQCKVRLIQDKYSRYRFLNLLEVTNTNPSII